jgi:cob(I)alamin adenosyltransferase
MAFKIYTRTGDDGTTSLIGGTKVSKSNIRIESYGTVDELNSWIGVLGDSVEDGPTRLTFREIQDRLFTIGSALACDPEKESKLRLPDLHQSDVTFLESEIDRMNEALQPMQAFILPGGATAVSFAHVARCVCRRAERICVAMQAEGMEIQPLVIMYLNRLSDYLFVVARFISYLLNVEEVQWKARV